MINEKHKHGALVQKISNKKAINSYYSYAEPIAKKYGIVLTDFMTGAGYLQWRLKEDGWQRFSESPESEKPFLAQEYETKKSLVKEALKDTFFKDDIFTVPDDGFIFYRRNPDGKTDFALAAWGFKFPNKTGGGELEYWVNKIPLQDVNIAFVWDGKKFPNLGFVFNNLPKKTGADGYFRLGDKIAVGRSFPVVTPDKKSENLVVEQDKSEYIYDITQYFDVEVSVLNDGNPVEHQAVELTSYKGTETLTTDTNGKAFLRLPLQCDGSAQLKPQQSPVHVLCRTESNDKTPSSKDERLLFEFQFFTPAPPPPPDDSEPQKEPESEPFTPEPESEPEPVPEFVSFKVLDYGGYPMPDLDIVLTTKLKGKIPLKTDQDGGCKVPKEWFEDKEKINIKFTVSDEYQKTHDIHSGKKRKKQ